MKLWASVTRVPDDAHHYCVVAIGEDHFADMRTLSGVPVMHSIEGVNYSLPGSHVESNLYARTPASDAVLGALFVTEGDPTPLDDIIEDAPYEQGCAFMSGYDSFEALHNALTLAGSKANPDWCYDTYINRVEVDPRNKTIEVPVVIVVTEEGAERVNYMTINLQ